MPVSSAKQETLMTVTHNHNKNSNLRVLFMVQDSAYPQMGVLYLMDALRKKGIDSEIVSCKISPYG